MATATKNGQVEKAAKSAETVTISPPNFQTITLILEGTAPYMQCAFSQKAKEKIRETQEAGQSARKGKKKEPRNFHEDFLAAQHVSTEGWNGIPAGAFRNAAIDVCRMVGHKMTHTKMSIFIESDGLDSVEGTPLVRIDSPNPPEEITMTVRNATGVCDLRVRPQWKQWGVHLTVRFDADQFTVDDVVNLFMRAGQQVGVGEGRPFSKVSNGLGFGLFRVAGVER